MIRQAALTLALFAAFTGARADTQSDQAAAITALSSTFPDGGGPFAETESARTILLLGGCSLTILSFRHNLGLPSTRAIEVTTDLTKTEILPQSGGRFYSIQRMVYPSGFTMGMIEFAVPTGTISAERHNVTTDMTPTQIIALPPLNDYPETTWTYFHQNNPTAEVMDALTTKLLDYQQTYCPFGTSQ